MIKRLIELLVLHANERKAIRNLAKLEWSTDFLIYLLKKAGIKGLTVRVRSKDGVLLEIINEYNAPVRDIYAETTAFEQSEIDALFEEG
jgi:hypothetical protein